MSPELIAILVTSLIEIAGLVILGWVAHDSGDRPERIGRIVAISSGAGR
jgi:hypothetical protein